MRLNLWALSCLLSTLITVSVIWEHESPDSRPGNVKHAMTVFYNFASEQLADKNRYPTSISYFVHWYGLSFRNMDAFDVPWSARFSAERSVPPTEIFSMIKPESGSLPWMGYSVSPDGKEFVLVGGANGRWVQGLGGVPEVVRPY